MMNSKRNKIVSLILVVTVIALAALWLSGCIIEHIEDTNGADNYELTTITGQQIIDRSYGALNVAMQTNFFSGMVTFSSNKFTGVYEVLYTNYIGKSDFQLDIYGLEVTSGNFKMCIVLNDEIIEVLEPQELIQYSLYHFSGTLRLVIAGESAAFSFEIAEFDYNLYEHY